MGERNFSVSPVQVFCFVLFYLLSGMLLFCGGSFFSALFAALFFVCLCTVAAAFCLYKNSSAELYGGAFGRFAPLFRYIAAFFTSFYFMRTLFAFSEKFSSFYNNISAGAFAPAVILLCVLSVCRGFSRASRFAELCVFALAGAMLLSLLGSKGEGLSFAIDGDAIFGGFDAIGAVPVIFSLYARCVTPESEKASDFAKNGAFSPSPLLCGIAASACAFAAYAFFCFTGWENIIISLAVCFFALSRLTLFALSLADLFACPEKGEGVKSFFFAAALCSFWAVFGSFFPYAAKTAGIFAAVLFPCAVFISTVLERVKEATPKA